MLDQLSNTLSASGFLPHGYCFQWTSGLLWAYVLSDSLIALAYYTIPAALWYFVRKRVDLPFNWIFVMFAVFILACGTTHIVAVWNIWQPVYWIDAAVKVVTATVSVGTAIVLWPLIPKALRLPSPAQMLAVNIELEREVEERRLAEKRANELAADLETKVAERVATAQRLTEELQVEVAQRKRDQEQFRLMLEGLPSGMLMVDAQGLVVFANRESERLFGYAHGDLPGRPVEALLPEAQRADHPRLRAEFMRSAEARVMGAGRDLHGRRKDGGEFPLEIGLSPIDTPDGPRVVATVIDVTARKRLEEAQQQLNEELEEKVRTRTAELLRSNEELGRSNVELQRFAYVASHDLQSPLRSISGFLQLLQGDYQGKLDDRADDWIRRVVANAERMSTMIRDVLTYSLIESRAQPFTPVSLAQVFDEAKAALEVMIRESAANVTRDELPVVAGDRAQLVQLMQNLINNAIKYRSATPPRIHAAVENNEGVWTVTMRDNGIGIDEKYHEQVFEMFRRLHTEQAYPGTGIGLAICRRVVQHHGGRIWLTSAPGQGSAVHFTIPGQRGDI